MTAVLCVLGLGDLAWLTHFLAHHRAGFTAAVAGATGWAWHHTRRTIRNPGTRVQGRDTPRTVPIREAAAA